MMIIETTTDLNRFIESNNADSPELITEKLAEHEQLITANMAGLIMRFTPRLCEDRIK
jgi:hypothetical protein